MHLQAFAYAAAKRYSGTYERADGKTLPAVRQWIAWNEPNLRLGLVPQWRRVGKKWVPQSAYDYADICTAISNGVHMTLLTREQVACGATAARGNNNPRARWSSVAPLGFMRAMRRAGVSHIDAYAHHAYAGGPGEAPWRKPDNPTALTLGNLPVLVREVTKLWGRKPVWISEYGYETSPPDSTFGVPWDAQAKYLTAARRHRPPEPARRHADVVPAPRRGPLPRLAVRPGQLKERHQAIVLGVPESSEGNRPRKRRTSPDPGSSTSDRPLGRSVETGEAQLPGGSHVARSRV